MTWRSLTPSFKRLIATFELWLGIDPPKLVAPTALAIRGIHFDLIEIAELEERPMLRVCSSLSARLAGAIMSGRFISEAPNTQWANSLLDQTQAARYARNLVYDVDHGIVDGHFANVHRLVIPLSVDGTIIDKYLIASGAVAAK